MKDFNESKLQEYFETESLEVLHAIKLNSDKEYFSGETCTLPDFKYDMLKETLQRRDPNYTPPIGHKIREGDNRVNLPYWLGSMDKIKLEDEKEMHRWLSKNTHEEYIIEDKLDGVSCLLEVVGGVTKLYTRGDGRVGADISYLSQYFITIPKNLDNGVVVRGELIMKKEVFESKYSKNYANPRNMVAGRLCGKKVREGLKDIDFIAYEVVTNDIELDPYTQLQYLESLGFSIANFDIISEISPEILKQKLEEFKKRSLYEIDGIVVQPNIYNERNTSGNPEYAFAFKMRTEENSAVVEVLDVEWNISKWGVLKPRVSITPVSLGGVTISYSSGFNAKYIMENNVGRGAVIRVTRSGDVIPYITQVISPAEIPAMPDIPYTWNETGVDISINEHNKVSEVKLISSFFSNMGIKHVSEATVSKMYEHGLVTLVDILRASKEDLAVIEGFGNRLAERTYDNIHNGLQNISLPLLLGASGIFGFGFGIKKIDALLSFFPDLLVIYSQFTEEELYNKVMSVEGFSDKSAMKIVNNIEKADKFVRSLFDFVTFKSVEVLTSDNLKGMKFVMSGFRDKDLEREIVKRGGKIVTSVSNNTSVLIVKNKEDNPSGKEKKANSLGKHVMTREEFKEEYLS